MRIRPDWNHAIPTERHTVEVIVRGEQHDLLMQDPDSDLEYRLKLAHLIRFGCDDFSPGLWATPARLEVYCECCDNDVDFPSVEQEEYDDLGQCSCCGRVFANTIWSPAGDVCDDCIADPIPTERWYAVYIFELPDFPRNY